MLQQQVLNHNYGGTQLHLCNAAPADTGGDIGRCNIFTNIQSQFNIFPRVSDAITTDTIHAVERHAPVAIKH